MINMTEYMNEIEYKQFIALQDLFVLVLEDCAKEIFKIEYGREPIGEVCIDDELYDDEKYMVQFETYSCGERDSETAMVPIEYIYDEGYREYYKKYLINERERKAQAALKRKVNKTVYRVVTDERSEYERLKKIYG